MAARALTLMLKLPGEACNIDCHYCYEKRKPSGRDGAVEAEQVAALLRAADGRPLAVNLHGGEPLIVGKRRMREIFAELRAYPGQLTLNMQTNGTLLDEEWLDLIQEEWPTLNLGVSLDGDHLANAFRVDYSGRPTSGRVEACLDRLGQRGLRVGIIAVINSRSSRRPRAAVEYFLRYPAVKVVKFTAAFDHGVDGDPVSVRERRLALRLAAERSGLSSWGLTPQQYTTFLCETLDAWRDLEAYEHFVLEPHASIFRALSGRDDASYTCYSSAKCERFLTLNPNGKVHGCDRLPAHEAVGDVSTVADLGGLAERQAASAIGLRLLALQDKCAGCAYAATCRGGCTTARLAFQGTPLDDEYCRHRMAVIDYFRAAQRG
ncbi:radical SAM protein [Nonomuraea sp. NPDC050786]|uniref:radical SAM/SPASM domain-containing protein n=1 Tax=Nonomuraea sp. NPDC050786 TaxID=3154840 RepID=UPI0033D8BEF5